MLGLLICPYIFCNKGNPHLPGSIVQKRIFFHRTQLNIFQLSIFQQNEVFFLSISNYKRMYHQSAMCQQIDRCLAGGKTQNIRKGVTKSLRDETLAQAILRGSEEGIKSFTLFSCTSIRPQFPVCSTCLKPALVRNSFLGPPLLLFLLLGPQL